MGLPSSPTFSFKIPSVHDETQLDCRVYLPPQLQRPETARKWQKKGAIVAHPYAPLGGCYDDPVVSSVGGELLEGGYVVGTFNFRGAGDSDGRTSWTAKPELADYVSFYGFMVYYLHGLDPRASPTQERESQQSQISDVGKNGSGELSPTLDVILGGYSYGSMIASHMPTVDVVLKLFERAPEGSWTAEVRSRAEQCSAHWNKGAKIRLQSQTADALGSTHPVILGQRSNPTKRSSSSETKVSMDGVRRSIDRAKRRLSLGSKTSDRGSRDSKRDIMDKQERQEIPMPRISYLLVSPILPPITNFLTMFSKMSLSTGMSSGTSAQGAHVPCPKPEEQLCAYPTLVVYGNKDTFTPSNKIGKWSDELASAPESKFQYREIDGAGHFWREEGTELQMRTALKKWLDHLQHEIVVGS